jgi:hypothetical protein
MLCELKSVGASLHPDKEVFHFSLHFLAMPTRSESILDHITGYLPFLSNAQLFWFTLHTSYDNGCHLANQFFLDPEDYKVLLIVASLVSGVIHTLWYHNQDQPQGLERVPWWQRSRQT